MFLALCGKFKGASLENSPFLFSLVAAKRTDFNGYSNRGYRMETDSESAFIRQCHPSVCVRLKQTGSNNSNERDLEASVRLCKRENCGRRSATETDEEWPKHVLEIFWLVLELVYNGYTQPHRTL